MSHPSVDRRTNRTHKSKSFEDSYTLSLSLFRGTLSLSQEVMEIFDLQWVNLLSEIFTIPRQGGGGQNQRERRKKKNTEKESEIEPSMTIMMAQRTESRLSDSQE